MNNLLLTISFFTIIRVPNRPFTEDNYRYLPLLIGVIGAIIGALAFGLHYLLDLTTFSPLLKAVIITSYFTIITGGLHVDGLLDTVDAHFSRRDLKRKLEIMHDSNVGAFACIFAILFFMLKVTIIRELLILDLININILAIPILSRLFTSLLICSAKFATDKGLASMYDGVVKNYYKFIILIQTIVFCGLFLLIDLNIIISLLAITIYFFLFLRFAYKNFKGITGDMLGAFVETSELVLFICLLGVGLWL